ncbi:MAG: MBL fold metallo-hydrolase [Candidatus Paceibacterota bacterium]
MKIKFIIFVISLIVFIYGYREYKLLLYPLNQISFLNIGQGDASLITSKRGARIIIDCGPDSKIIDQLESKLSFWARRIDMIIITHGDKDHYGGCRDIIEKYKVGKVMINGVFDTKNQAYQGLLEFIREKEIQILPSIENTYITLGDSIELHLLNPQTNLWSQDIRDDNSESIVILLRSKNNKILLTGDADEATEAKILQKYPQLDIDILKAGHHGSKTSTSDKLLDAITPKQVIISAGANNSYNHPHPDIINKLKTRKIEIQEVKNFMTGIDILL